MKKTIYSRFDKKAITELPQVLFPGRIITIINESDADKAVDYLLTCDILGVDTETRPTFKKGQQHQVALLQVATHDTCSASEKSSRLVILLTCKILLAHLALKI